MPVKIHHEISISAEPQRIYEALTDAKQFAGFTGEPAEIVLASGGPFSCFGGMITGQTIEAVPCIRLVQAWRVGHWDPGIYSIVKFEFVALDSSTTNLIFDHTGFPEEHRDHLEQGWHDKYWKPLIKYFNS